MGAYRQVSPGSAWTRLRSHGRVGGALHLQRRRRRDSGELHEHAASAEEYGPDGGSVRGDKYVPDTEEVYWQRDPADLPELYQKELSGAARASIPELYQKELSGL